MFFRIPSWLLLRIAVIAALLVTCMLLLLVLKINELRTPVVIAWTHDVSQDDGTALLASDTAIVLGNTCRDESNTNKVAAKLFSTAGRLRATVNNDVHPVPYLCGNNIHAVLGAKDTFYAVAAQDDIETVAAYQDGQVKWVFKLPEDFSGVRALRLGRDGRVYAILTNQTVADRLVGLDAQSGKSVLDTPIGSHDKTADVYMSPHSHGLTLEYVFGRRLLSVQYVTYAGLIAEVRTITDARLMPGNTFLATQNGRLFAGIDGRPAQGCEQSVAGIRAFDARSDSWQTPIENSCGELVGAWPTARGGAIVQLMKADATGRLLAFDQSGKQLWIHDIKGERIRVDEHGNIVMFDRLSASTPELSVFDGETGELQFVFRDWPAELKHPDYAYYWLDLLSIARGRVYLVLPIYRQGRMAATKAVLIALTVPRMGQGL